MEGTLRVGRIAGIPIGIHYTLLFAFFLITWTLAVGFFPQNLRGQPAATYWIMGAVAAAGLFVSVLLHELAHSLVALAYGLKVHSITLFIFGGVSQISTDAEKPGQEFTIAVVGPVISLLLAGIFWGAGGFLGGIPTPVSAILGYLALINLLLGVFNLLPGFPLDGGRVLRSILWGFTNNMVRATNIATYVGQALAWLLIGAGVVQVFAGNIIGGLWTGLIGWFLNNGAESSRRDMQLRERTSQVPIAALIPPDPGTVSPNLPVSELVYEHLVRRGRRALPVVSFGGQVVGIVSISDVKHLPAEQWPFTAVSAIMTKYPLHAVSPETDLLDALRLLDERDINQVLVLQEGHLVGLLSRADVLRFLKLREELGPQSLRAP